AVPYEKSIRLRLARRELIEDLMFLFHGTARVLRPRPTFSRQSIDDRTAPDRRLPLRRRKEASGVGSNTAINPKILPLFASLKRPNASTTLYRTARMPVCHGDGLFGH